MSWRHRLALAAGGLVLAIYFAAHAWDAWPETTVLGADDDVILLGAHQFVHDGVIPVQRSYVSGTNISLGPLFPMWVGVCQRLAGGDLHDTWVLLVTGLCVGMLVGGALLVRAAGLRIGIPAVAALFADPQLYAELRWPFYYLHQMTPLLMACSAGLIGMHTRASVAWWYMAVIAGGLATPVHAMCWMVIPIVVIAGLASARTLGTRHLVAGLVLFVIVAWPFFGMLTTIANPAKWQTFLHDASDPAVVHTTDVYATALRSMGRWLSMRVPAAIVVLPLAALACVEQLVRPQASEPERPVTAVVASAWFVCFSWPLVVSAHRLHDHYTFPLGIALALAMGLLVARLTPSQGMGRRLVPVAAAVLLLTRVGMAPEHWGSWPPSSPWITWQVLDPGFDAIARAGIGKEDVEGGERRVHGTPCAWRDRRWCGSNRWLLASRLGPVSADVDLNLGIGAGGAVESEAGPRCLTWTETGRVHRTCGTAQHLHVVAGVAAGQQRAWTEGTRAAGWEPGFCADGAPGTAICVMHRPLPPFGGGDDDLTVPRQAGDAILDVFASSRVWDAARFGMVEIPAPGSGTPQPAAAP